MGILFTITMGFLFTITLGILFTIVLGIQFTISKNTIYCWVSQRRIPFVKCGRLTKFDLQKIEKWIEENSVEEGKFE